MVMRHVVALAALLVATMAADARDGDPDRYFGDTGRVAVGIDNVGSTLTDRGLGSLPMADGGVLVIGTAAVANGTGVEVVCVRLTPEGRLDPAYGANGRRTLQTAFTHIAGIAEDGPFRIVLFGHRDMVAARPAGGDGARGNVVNRAYWLHAILGADCTTNADFGDGGTLGIDFDLGGANADEATAAVWGDAPRKLFVVGNVDAANPGDRDIGVVVLDPAGDPVTTFGPNGRRRVFFDAGGNDADGATDVTVRGGKVLVAGTARTDDGTDDAALVRLDVATGLVDPTFCAAGACPDSVLQALGKRTIRLYFTAANESRVRVEAGFDTFVYVAATTRPTAAPQDFLALARLADNGTLDADFGGGALFGIAFGTLSANTRPTQIDLLSSGLVVAGTTGANDLDGANPDSRFFIARFGPDSGVGDPAFSSTPCPGGSTFCAVYAFDRSPGEPVVDNELAHARLLSPGYLLTGTRLFRRSAPVEDTDIAVLRTAGEIFFRHSFE